MRVGSMFAGIGGICIAFKDAGADLVWANEKDPFACKTYCHNFGSEFLMEADVRDIDASLIPNIDVLTAGFPCQPFSVMGKLKGFSDPRGTMYFEILRVIDEKKPPVVFLENVKNIIFHDNGRTFSTICMTLKERGYSIKYAVLGANTHANIPQYRDRLFLTAFRNREKMKRFSFPDRIPLNRTINDIINREKHENDKYYYKQTNLYYKDLRDRMINDTAIYRIDDSGVATYAWNVCPTLKANMGTYHDRVPVIRDCYGIRKLTPKECLALQGFPNSFEFPDIPENEIYKQLGNTVCVRVVERIAQEIHKTVRLET